MPRRATSATEFASLPAEAFVPVGVVASVLRVSISTVWQWVKANPEFPRPSKLGKQATRWNVGELRAWLFRTQVPQVEGTPPQPTIAGTEAFELLRQAAQHMQDRASTYDKPGGERSMAATVSAFNSITGRDLRESEGWLLMAILKMVRSETRDKPHRDSVEDLIAYCGLYGEARITGQ